MSLLDIIHANAEVIAQETYYGYYIALYLRVLSM